MRKNGVNRKLREIQGGVCAPVGFKANGVRCGILQGENKKDLAIIVAEKRCPTACVFSVNSAQSAPARISKRHLKSGLARAILVNSGIANVFLENGEWLAEKLCRVLASRSDIDVNDTLLASTGKVGESLPLAPFENGIPELVKGLSASEEGSFAAAEAIMTTDKSVKQLAFEFDLGDFPCRIGAIFKGATQVCPNMATTLAFLTTDVNISSKTLQKALSTTVKDTFNLISVDGISSPNDTVCIMASCKAGNYKISDEDSEYAKFVYALKEVLTEICKRIVKDGDQENRLLVCKVLGARSKQIARASAKALACAQGVKEMLLSGQFDVANVLYLINSFAQDVDFSKAQVSVSANESGYIAFEEGRTLQIKEESVQKLMQEKEVVLSVRLGMGNYAARAFGCIEPYAR